MMKSVPPINRESEDFRRVYTMIRFVERLTEIVIDRICGPRNFPPIRRVEGAE